jgi:hypothetical protein
VWKNRVLEGYFIEVYPIKYISYAKMPQKYQDYPIASSTTAIFKSVLMTVYADERDRSKKYDDLLPVQDTPE